MNKELYSPPTATSFMTTVHGNLKISPTNLIYFITVRNTFTQFQYFIFKLETERVMI